MSHSKQDLLQHHSAEAIIAKLAPFVGNARKQRIDDVLSCRINSVQIAIENPADIHNALAIVRTAEALGINHIHIINPENRATSARGITQGANFWTHTHYHENLSECFAHARQLPTQYLAQTEQQQALCLAGAFLRTATTLAEIPIDKPLCLIFGNEERGLSEAAQQTCDMLYKIPMYGMTESFNLSVSAGISLHDVLRRRRELLGQTGDLKPEALLHERALYYMHSVSERLLQGVLGGRVSP